MDCTLDCVIVGAGPAGLTAAIYLSRFNLVIRVLDDGASRCATIPRTHNHAGFPSGIEGKELLRRMREQAAGFGAHVTDRRVFSIQPTENNTFLIDADGENIAASTVLLATGVVNNRPRISDARHDLALAEGLIRYCPVCDGYEVNDRTVGVIGTGPHGYREAVFLRMHTEAITLIAPNGEHELTKDQRCSLSKLGISIADGPCGDLRLEGASIVAPIPRATLRFDAIYPALGSTVRSDLAIGLGAAASEQGCLVVDDHQRTSVPGLYAAGDVVRGLDQIGHAMGEAGVAATTIRNDLARTRVLARGRPPIPRGRPAPDA